MVREFGRTTDVGLAPGGGGLLTVRASGVGRSTEGVVCIGR